MGKWLSRDGLFVVSYVEGSRIIEYAALSELILLLFCIKEYCHRLISIHLEDGKLPYKRVPLFLKAPKTLVALVAPESQEPPASWLFSFHFRSRLNNEQANHIHDVCPGRPGFE
jgi:hypothetical protein